MQEKHWTRNVWLDFYFLLLLIEFFAFRKLSFLKLLEKKLYVCLSLLHVYKGLMSQQLNNLLNFFFFRTFSKPSNQNELLEICRELSDYVSKDLQNDNLEVFL